MKKTIEAFDKVRESATRLEEAANMLIAHIDSMTAQNTPSQSVKQEPEYWEVRNGVCKHGVYRTKEQAEDVCFDMQKSHDLSGSLASFNVRPLYAAPVDAKAIHLSEKTKDQIWLENEVAIKTDPLYLVGRAEALEEAAEQCDRIASNGSFDAEDCAEAIRGME